MENKTINNDIEESYCSFEVSKLLKEKGFDCKVKGTRNSDTPFSEIDNCQIPNHALAIEWIRVNFGIWIEISISIENKWYFTLLNLESKRNAEIYIINDKIYNSPQEATEAALLYVLKELI